MADKKKNSTAADNLIESLMDDLKDISLDSSIADAGNSFVDKIKGDEIGMPMLDDANTMDVSELDLDVWKKEALGEVNDPVGKVKLKQEVVDINKANPAEEKTLAVNSDVETFSTGEKFENGPPTNKADADKTLAVTGFANAKPMKSRSNPSDVKVSVGKFRGSKSPAGAMTSLDASLAQSENLKLAQERITELETELETLRSENEELASAGEIVRTQVEALNSRIHSLEKEKLEIQESAQSEILILKGGIQFKESEAAKARIKIDELEARLKADFKKIRVRERELENRLELLRAEKSALVRSKDDYILDQKRKIDQLSAEIENYRKKCLELNKVIEANQDQVKRTERALRLALTNLETKDDGAVPLKKAD